MKNKKAFTLIELLVVISIIGILATLSVVVVNNARAKARDARRVADIKQIQTALELYYEDVHHYPTNAEFLAGSLYSTSSLLGTTTYIGVIPLAPESDGVCSESDNTYTYQQLRSGSDYRVKFCVGAPVGSLREKGRYMVGPEGFTAINAQTLLEICNNINSECDSACPIGSVCGGGTIFSTNPNLVAAPSQNSEFGCVGSQSCTGNEDNINTIYNWGPSSETTGATDANNGQVNMATIKSFAGESFYLYPAFKACDDLNTVGLFHFTDWYLPSKNELAGLLNSKSIVPGMTTEYRLYRSSSEDGESTAYTSSIYAALPIISSTKIHIYGIVRCIRRF